MPQMAPMIAKTTTIAVSQPSSQTPKPQIAANSSIGPAKIATVSTARIATPTKCPFARNEANRLVYPTDYRLINWSAAPNYMTKLSTALSSQPPMCRQLPKSSAELTAPIRTLPRPSYLLQMQLITPASPCRFAPLNSPSAKPRILSSYIPKPAQPLPLC